METLRLEDYYEEFLIVAKNADSNDGHIPLGARVPLGRSGSGSVIRDQSDYGRSNERMNPCPEWINRFI